DQRRTGRSALLLFSVVAAAARDPELVEGKPVRQPVEPAGPLRADRARDLGTDRRTRHPSGRRRRQDRKSTRLNSSHRTISYAVFPQIYTLSLHDALPI